MKTNTTNAGSGMFRALALTEAAEFTRAGSADYVATANAGLPFELNPMHHPSYRKGALLAALEHVTEELQVIAATRSVEEDAR